LYLIISEFINGNQWKNQNSIQQNIVKPLKDVTEPNLFCLVSFSS